MTALLEADYLVVGAGATGMAFTDALIDHNPEARVALVDRRHSVGGHWLDAYPFVQLHQSSAFYGVPSTLLGGGQLQQHGPEAGLQERASQAEITVYYARAMDRMRETGRVDFFPNSEHDGDRTVVDGAFGALGRLLVGVGDAARAVQTGFVRSYAATMTAGLVVLVAVVLATRI